MWYPVYYLYYPRAVLVCGVVVYVSVGVVVVCDGGVVGMGVVVVVGRVVGVGVGVVVVLVGVVVRVRVEVRVGRVVVWSGVGGDVWPLVRVHLEKALEKGEE